MTLEIVDVLSETIVELGARVRAVRDLIDKAEADVAMHGGNGLVDASALRKAVKYFDA